MPNFFDKEKYVIHYENLQIYLRLRLKLKKSTLHIRIQSVSMPKTTCWVQHKKKRIEAEENCTGIVQINEQCCVWKNNGKLKE